MLRREGEVFLFGTAISVFQSVRAAQARRMQKATAAELAAA
jgi:hypothetical protein